MKAILPLLDESRKRPYYLQVYDYIKEAILTGNIMAVSYTHLVIRSPVSYIIFGS